MVNKSLKDIEFKQIDNIPSWEFKTDNISEEGDELIRIHVKECGSVVQFDNVETDIETIKKLLIVVRKTSLTPKFIHIYPADITHISTVSVYVKEDIRTGK